MEPTGLLRKQNAGFLANLKRVLENQADEAGGSSAPNQPSGPSFALPSPYQGQWYSAKTVAEKPLSNV